MENGAVYNETTEPHSKVPRRPCGCTLQRLRGWKLAVKVLQPDEENQQEVAKMRDYLNEALLSLLAVIFEEIVENCNNCGGLYFFEFTSCSAFLLSLLILCVYCTAAYETFGADQVKRVNFWAMLAIGISFLLASIVLAATSSGSAFENTACAFGFFSSGAFLAEFVMEYWDNQKKSTKERSENSGNTQGATESHPLNE